LSGFEQNIVNLLGPRVEDLRDLIVSKHLNCTRWLGVKLLSIWVGAYEYARALLLVTIVTDK